MRSAYDAVAAEYERAMRDELDGKPLDRALLTAFTELCGAGTIADVGCGPGHVTRFLAELQPDVVGVDLSPGMISRARQAAPELRFEVGSMTDLPTSDGAWAGAVLLYSIIHLSPAERHRAFGELRRVVRPGGWLLISFHVSSDDHGPGETNHLTTWFGQDVDIDGHFLAPETVASELEAAGLAIAATLLRQPVPDAEFPSRRAYLLAQVPSV